MLKHKLIITTLASTLVLGLMSGTALAEDNNRGAKDRGAKAERIIKAKKQERRENKQERKAERTAKRTESLVTKYDADGDGNLTSSELSAAQAAKFTLADSDADGTLSASELAIYVTTEVNSRVNDTVTDKDSDGDGLLSAEEMGRKYQRLMDQGADSNGDGLLSSTEITTAVSANITDKQLDKLDTDSDGNLSAAEYAAKLSALFDRLDKDEDGILSIN